MDLSRRDLFKLGGTATAALGLSQLKVQKFPFIFPIV